MTNQAIALNYPLPSSDGRLVAGTNPNSNEQLIFDARDWSRPPERLPTSPAPGQTYLRDWSPDGRRLAADDTANSVWLFDLHARTWERVGAGQLPRWLADGRRVVVANSGRISVIDTITKSEHDIYQEPGRFITSVAVAPDGRWLYFTSADTQSEIWTMRPAR